MEPWSSEFYLEVTSVDRICCPLNVFDYRAVSLGGVLRSGLLPYPRYMSSSLAPKWFWVRVEMELKMVPTQFQYCGSILPWSVKHKAVSSILRYARPRFHRLFRPSRLAPDEQHAFRCLPMNTTHYVASHEHDNDAVSPFRHSHSHVHEPWPYVCASRRSRPRLYVRMWTYFLSCTLAVVRTCTRYVRASTTTRARLYYDTCPYLLGHGSSM